MKTSFSRIKIFKDYKIEFLNIFYTLITLFSLYMYKIIIDFIYIVLTPSLIYGQVNGSIYGYIIASATYYNIVINIGWILAIIIITTIWVKYFIRHYRKG